MEKGTTWTTRYLMKELAEKKDEIEMYIADVCSREHSTFSTPEEVEETFGTKVDRYSESLTYRDAETLRHYTGYYFRFINNVMRNKWNYYENGLLTEEKKQDYLKIGEAVRRIIHKFPKLDANIKTYRGVSLRAFYDYGITSLEELVHMEGKYMLEDGFSSTSLLRDHSFFEKELGWADYCNIEIEFIIPEESQDGALLLSESLSYAQAQIEYVINCNSLFKITSVQVDKANKRAYIKAVLVPKVLWDPIAVRQLDEETNRHTK